MHVTWHGHTWVMDSLTEGEAWIAQLDALYAEDQDAAEQLAYEGPLGD